MIGRRYQQRAEIAEARLAVAREALERIKTRIPPPESNEAANRMWMIAREALLGLERGPLLRP